MLFPLLLLGVGGATLLAFVLSSSDTPPDHKPDEAAAQGKTGYRLVDAILDELRKAAAASGIPLGVLIGWIAKESGGKLADTTKYDERGLFQLMPAESKALGLDHQRLSTDLVYSINAGLLLIGYYAKMIAALAVAPQDSSYFWKLVKLAHSMGSGAVKKIVTEAKAAGQAHSWDQLENWALDHNDQILSETKHSPSKWFPFVESVAALGAPFGFGDDTSTAVVGADEVYSDIVDPLDCLARG